MKLRILCSFWLVFVLSGRTHISYRKGGLICAFLSTMNCCNVDGCWTVQNKLIKIFENENITEEKKVYLLRNVRFLVFIESTFKSFKNIIIFMMPLLGICYFLLRLRLSTTVFIGEAIFLINYAIHMYQHSREVLCVIN